MTEPIDEKPIGEPDDLPQEQVIVEPDPVPTPEDQLPPPTEGDEEQ